MPQKATTIMHQAPYISHIDLLLFEVVSSYKEVLFPLKSVCLFVCQQVYAKSEYDRDKPLRVVRTDQRQQQRVEVCGGAAGVHAEHLAALPQPSVD